MNIFEKPAVGSKITVVCDWSENLKGYSAHVPRTSIDFGVVVPSEKFDDPKSFRLATSNKIFPVSVIPLMRVVEISGVEVKKVSVKNNDRVWVMPSSNGKSSYTVSRVNGIYSCTCVGYSFRHACKHVNKAKESK